MASQWECYMRSTKGGPNVPTHVVEDGDYVDCCLAAHEHTLFVQGKLDQSNVEGLAALDLIEAKAEESPHSWDIEACGYVVGVRRKSKYIK